MATSCSIVIGVLSIALGAAIFGLIFSLPVHSVVVRHAPEVRRRATFIAVTLAIFVEYGIAAAGCQFAVQLVNGHAGHASYVAVAATIFLAVSAATFFAGSWMFGCVLGLPRNHRLAHGALANSMMLLCNGALVAVLTGLERAIN